MWMKGFLFYITRHCEGDSPKQSLVELEIASAEDHNFAMTHKEARMNIKRNFWKQGPLLAGLPVDSLNCK
jgi:hypothetical protein